jgi:DHA2 family multidrug resistance protein
VSLAGAWLMTGLNLDVTARSTIAPLLMQGFGIGFVFIPLSAVAFATLPKGLATEAAGVYNLIRSLGSSIGISIVSVYMTRSAQASWATLRQYVDPFRPEVRQYLDPLHLKAQGAGLALLAQQVAQQAQMIAMLKAFWLIFASFVAMIPLVLLLRPSRPGTPPPAAAVGE